MIRSHKVVALVIYNVPTVVLVARQSLDAYEASEREQLCERKVAKIARKLQATKVNLDANGSRRVHMSRKRTRRRDKQASEHTKVHIPLPRPATTSLALGS